MDADRIDTDVEEPKTKARPDRTLLVILVAIGLLVVIALVAVTVRSVSHELLDASTPQGVVQRYAQAVIDNDKNAAAKYLTSPTVGCDYNSSTPTNVRLTMLSSSTTATNATVRVTVSTTSDGDPLSSYESSYDDEFQLVKSGDSWLIQYAPYEFATCIGSAN